MEQSWNTKFFLLKKKLLVTRFWHTSMMVSCRVPPSRFDEHLLSWENNFPWLALYKASACAWQGRPQNQRQKKPKGPEKKKASRIEVEHVFFFAKEYHMVVSWNRGTRKSSIDRWIFHYKPSILGYPRLWNPPYGNYLLYGDTRMEHHMDTPHFIVPLKKSQSVGI